MLSSIIWPVAVIPVCLLIFSVIAILSVPRSRRVEVIKVLIQPWLVRR